MAITHIHPISSSVIESLNYVVADKEENKLVKDADFVIDYVTADKNGTKYYATLSTYLNGCVESEVKENFQEHITSCLGSDVYAKSSKTKNGEHYVAWHLVQSFKGYEVTQQEANEIGVELCRDVFANHMCVVSTHTNTDDVHNHIVICAWDNDGKKWNNCNENYARIREASDRICEMWGVSVLWDTHRYKLQNVYDKQGQLIGKFEPTERKIKIAKERAAKKATGDVGDYRNTNAYAWYKEREEKMRQTVKSDIDNLLPHIKSYDELLNELRNIGYRIKDKKKNGDWLKHISFTPPMTDKGVRDYRLGDGEYYTREVLSAYIEKMVKADLHAKGQPDFAPEKNRKKADSDLKYYEEYDFNDINSSNLNFKMVRDGKGGYKVVVRIETEMFIIQGSRIILKDSYLYGTDSELCKMFRECRQARWHHYTEKRMPYKNIISPEDPQYKVKKLACELEENMHSLRFVEKHNLYSYSRICALQKNRSMMLVEAENNLEKAKEQIKYYESLQDVPERLEAVKKRLEENKDKSVMYIFESYYRDKAEYERLSDLMRSSGYNADEFYERLRLKIEKAKEHLAECEKKVEDLKIELSEYELCISVLNRMDLQQKKRKSLQEHNNPVYEKNHEIERGSRVREKERSGR